MSIYSKKFDALVEDIIATQIRSGKLPTSAETIAKIMSATSRKDLTKPEYLFYELQGTSVISSKGYGEIMDDILKDLDVIYANYKDLQAMYTRSMRSYEVDRLKLEQQLQELEDKLKEKILVNSDTSALNSVYDTFTDTSKVDTIKTTAMVDIKNRKVSISPTRTGLIPRENISVSVDLNPKFSVVSDLYVGGYNPIVREEVFIDRAKTLLDDNIRQENSKSIGNVIKDYVNNIKYSSSLIDRMFVDKANMTWTREIVSNINGGAGLVIKITFKDVTKVNQLSIDMHTVKPAYIKLKYSPDGLNTISVPYHEEAKLCNNRESFNFPNIGMKVLYIELTKTEADKTTIKNGKDNYVYYFGVSNLSLYSNGYATEGTLVSKPLYADSTEEFPINKVSLETDSVIPIETNIDYYVALAADAPTWYSISPLNDTNPAHSQIIDFKNISENVPVTFNISSTTSIKEKELPSLKTNGINFYSLGSVGSETNPITIIDGSAKLYKGVGFWQIKSAAHTFSSSSYIPKIEDWFALDESAAISYVSVESNKVLENVTSAEARVYKVSITFECRDQLAIKAIPVCNFPMSVYVNTKLIYESTTPLPVNYVFQKGFNKIDVLIYKTVSANLNLDLNIDLNKLGYSFYADSSPMTLTTLFNLQYKIPNNKHNYYAIMNINGKNIIVVNQITQDIDYEFHYKYTNDLTSNGILFKAVLSSKKAKSTPSLNAYRIKLM